MHARSVENRRVLAQQRKAKGSFIKRVPRKIDDTFVTQKNLNGILDLVLNVSEAYAKPCSAKIVLKIVRASMLHGIILKRKNRCAKTRRCESSCVTLVTSPSP